MISFKTDLLFVPVWAGLPRIFLRMSILWSPYSLTDFTTLYFVSVEQGQSPEPVFLNVYGAPELIPRNEFRQRM